MSDEQKADNGNDGAADDKNENGERSGRMGDGIRQGLGVLTAFKDALEETIQEARERGDLSTERAKEVMKETLEKAQTAAEGAKEKLDFANQGEMEAVRGALDTLRERVGALEESVFGASKGDRGEAAAEDPTKDGSGGPSASEEDS